MAASNSDDEPAFLSISERIAALQKDSGKSSPPIVPSSSNPKRNALTDRRSAFQTVITGINDSASLGTPVLRRESPTSVTYSQTFLTVSPPITPSPTKPKRKIALADRIAAYQIATTGQVQASVKTDDGARYVSGKSSNGRKKGGTNDAAPLGAYITHQCTDSVISQDIEGGSAVIYEKNAHNFETVSIEDDDDDLTLTNTYNLPYAVINTAIDSVDSEHLQPADQKRADALHGAAASEDSTKKTIVIDQFHFANDIDVESTNIIDDVVNSSDAPTTNIGAPDLDEHMNDDRGHFQAEQNREVVAIRSTSIDLLNLDKTDEVPYQAEAATATQRDDNCNSEEISLDCETVKVQIDQSDMSFDFGDNLLDVEKESNDAQSLDVEKAQSQMKESAEAVDGVSTKKADTTQPRTRLNIVGDNAITLANEAMLSLRREQGPPVDIDEEMAVAPVDVDDEMSEAPLIDDEVSVSDDYEERSSFRAARSFTSYILVACVALLAIIAAVVGTSIGRNNSADEPSTASTSSTSSINDGWEGKNSTVDLPVNVEEETKIESVILPLMPSSLPSASLSLPTSRPSSVSYPSFVPSAYPTSQSHWIQSAVSTFTQSKESLSPSSNPPIVPHTSSPTIQDKVDTITPTTGPSPLPSTPNPTTPPTANPTTLNPTQLPTHLPSTANPTPRPTIAQVSFNETNPTHNPSTRPTPQQRKGCITTSTYEEIDSDIERLKNDIPDDKTRAHFLGGIVRLVAHDFMDYDRNNETHKMGPDGCFDPFHQANAGLPDDMWCSGCLLTTLYATKYSTLSRADFWIASANAVIRQTSVDNGLDLRSTFQWGRVDRDSCPGSALRLPSPVGCTQTEDVFVTRMGLTWRHATALMGAHTLGRGDIGFSGHEGTWSPNNLDAQVFDKKFYEEVFLNSWRPRNIGTATEDWTTDDGVDRVMLNTDLCLVMELDGNMPCCSSNLCTGSGSGLSRCPRLPENHPRSEAFEAFEEFLGGSYPNNNQVPFYNAFREAWTLATTVGQENLYPLADNCDIEVI